MIVVIGSVVAQDGQLEPALAHSRAHVERSRAEPGCLSHAVHVDSENPSRLVFVERWADMDALRQHFVVPASREFGKTLAALAAEAPTLDVYDAEPIDLRARS